MKKTGIQVSRSSSKRGVLATAIALVLPLVVTPAAPVLAQDAGASQASSAGAQSQQTYQFDIPAKSLPQAIADLSAVTGLQVLYTEQSTFDYTAPALRGSYTVREALQRLLAESGLVMRFTGENSVTIELASQDGVHTLPPVRVSASAEAQVGSAAEGYKVSNTTGIGPWGERSIQDSPYSISVISENLLENAFVTDMDQIAKITPTVQFARTSNYDDSQYASIRGFNVDAQVIDGMRLSSIRSRGISMEEVERVEILAGASGFMYGGGQVGGAVNYVLKRPTKERLSKVTVGNYGGEQYFGHIDLGGPIDSEGKFGYRFNAMYQDGDTSLDDQSKEESLVSGAFDWRVSDDLLIQFEASRRDLRLDGLSTYFSFGSGETLPDAEDLDSHETYTPSWTYLDSQTDRASLRANWRINDIFSVRASYMYRNEERVNALSSAYSQGDGTFATYAQETNPYESEQQGAYGYLDANFNTGVLGHNVTIGVSSEFNENYRYEKWGASDGSLRIALEDLNSYEKPTLDISDKGEWYKYSDVGTQNIILGDDITINDEWSLLAGANYSTIESAWYAVSGAATSKYEESEWTPTLSVIFKPSEQLTTYVTYIEALEEGITVGDSYANAGEVLPPLVSKQYELGAKYDLDNNLLLTTTLFRIEKANQYADASTTPATYVQDGLQLHQGLELTITGKLNDHLTVTGGGTLMDLSVEDAANPDLEGMEPVNAASQTAKIYMEYSISAVEGLFVTGGVFYTGEQYVDTINSVEIPAYATADLGVRYSPHFGDTPVTLRFNVSNLTDEEYWANSHHLGTPRTISFSASMNF